MQKEKKRDFFRNHYDVPLSSFSWFESTFVSRQLFLLCLKLRFSNSEDKWLKADCWIKSSLWQWLSLNIIYWVVICCCLRLLWLKMLWNWLLLDLYKVVVLSVNASCFQYFNKQNLSFFKSRFLRIIIISLWFYLNFFCFLLPNSVIFWSQQNHCYFRQVSIKRWRW